MVNQSPRLGLNVRLRRGGFRGGCVFQIEVHNKRAKEQSWGNILLARATQPYEQVVKTEIKSASRWWLFSGGFFFFFEKKKRVIFSLFRRNYTYRDFPGGSDSKVSAYNVGDLGLIPGSEDPLEKEMATHSSTLAWKIPWTEEPGGLQPMGSQRVGHNWETKLSNFHTYTACTLENTQKFLFWWMDVWIDGGWAGCFHPHCLLPWLQVSTTCWWVMKLNLQLRLSSWF